MVVEPRGNLRAVLLRVCLDRVFIDDSPWSAQTVEHAIGAALKVDPLDIIAIARDVGNMKKSRVRLAPPALPPPRPRTANGRRGICSPVHSSFT